MADTIRIGPTLSSASYREYLPNREHLGFIFYFFSNEHVPVHVHVKHGSEECIFIHQHPHPQYDKYLDEQEFSKLVLDDGNIVWGEDWDLIFPIEQLHAGTIS